MEPAPTNPLPPLLYRPLEGQRTIRLLRLCPGQENRYSYAFVHIDIDKAPPYVALSYTWGDQTHDHTITIDSQSLSIHKNLADALSALFNTVFSVAKFFWADAICINQQSLPERSSQVRLMNAIYRGAAQVYIWLGPAFPGSDALFDIMRARELDFDTDVSIVKLTSMGPSLRKYMGPPGSIEDRTWTAFFTLCAHKWWSRAWIVQEATVSEPSRVRLCCGSRSVSWTCFRTTLKIGYVMWGMGRATHMFGPGMVLRIDEFRSCRECGIFPRFLHVLQHVRYYECMDARDKVYAAVGMAGDVFEGAIVPDYTKSVVDVFMDVVTWGLAHGEKGAGHGHALDFLGHVVRLALHGLRSCDGEMPSWVPDWRMWEGSSALRKYIAVDMLDEVKAYNASGNLRVDATIEGRKLLARGLHVDEIGQVLSVVEDGLSENRVGTERTWIPASRLHETYHATNESVSQAFNRTIMADIGELTDTNSRRIAARLERPFSMDWTLEATSPSSLTPSAAIKRHSMILTLIKATLRRRLFWTKNGLMGLGPAAAAVGDEVCVLFGGQVLYVVRRLEDGMHEFVGECYVHGLMDGEAVKGIGTEGGGWQGEKVYVFK